MESKKPVTPNRLIEENQGLVYHLASRIHRVLPVRYDYDDLVGYGMLGLTEAAKAFVPSKGAKFSTFAFFRIRGAIFDGVSEGSWMTRAQYRLHVRKMKAVEESRGADPTEGDPAEWSYSPAEILELTSEHARELPDNDSQASASTVASRRETTEILVRAVEVLPRRENRLIMLVYFEGISLQEAADRIGISKSWASRLHARILQDLGMEISRLDKEPVFQE